jgi:nucleotide-binding universal stress UspA family protein
MYQRIMVAVDGSETAERGLQVIDLVVMYEFGEPSVNYIDSTREFARNTIERARQTARAAGIEPEIQSPEIYTSGYHVADTIAELARDWKADLLVAGTHGRRGVSRLLLGSVAERIVRVAPCPLLLVGGHPD